jgi:uncharacterized protein (TIGR02246 family)
MSPDEMRAAIETQIRAWQTGDADLLAAGFTPNGEIVVPGKRIQGHDTLKATVKRFASRHRDVQVTLRQMAFGLDCMALDYRWEDTKIETGERYIADDAVWVEFEGGLIRRWREYWDSETPKQQSAAAEGQPGAGR